MIAVVGEALVDVVHAPDGSRREHPGGSPANVALGLARLGHDVTLFTQVGRDHYGDLVREHLTSSGVVLADGCLTDGRTSSATAHLDGSGSATYTFDLTWDPDTLVLPPRARALHTGSLGTLLSPGAAPTAALVAEARDAGLLVSFDPNVRPSLVRDRTAYLADVEALVRLAHLVKASDEDLAYLYPDVPVAEQATFVAREWCERLGATLVVVTRGADGALAVRPSSTLAVPGLTVDVRDTVGAGDAFMSGLLDGLVAAGGSDPEALAELSPDALLRAVEHAVAVAAVTCSRPGADPPTMSELPSRR